jgi:hypothetical protein
MLPLALQASFRKMSSRAKCPPSSHLVFSSALRVERTPLSNNPMTLSASPKASCEPTCEPRSTPIETHDGDHFGRRLYWKCRR